MPPKVTPNGFYVFMVEERNKLRELKGPVPSMQDMPRLCADSWKRLSPDEKLRYDEIAKEDKCRQKATAAAKMYKVVGQDTIIGERRNPIDEEARRKNEEIQALMNSWERKDVRNIKFHLINFQTMYIDDYEDCYLPMEVGIVCITLNGGILKHLHHFIDPGDAPQGNRHLALKHSDDTHKIPLNFERGTSDFLGLWRQIERFIVEDPVREDVPPIFCLREHRKTVELCLDYIHYKSGIKGPNRFLTLYTLEDLVMSLILHSGKTDQRPSEGQVKDSLLRNQWDYISSIRCSYHDELDCSYCSLAIVRRLSFSIFDMLSNLLDFKLTVNHMPDETTNTSFTVMHPPGFSRAHDNRSAKSSTLMSPDKRPPSRLSQENRPPSLKSQESRPPTLMSFEARPPSLMSLEGRPPSLMSFEPIVSSKLKPEMQSPPATSASLSASQMSTTEGAWGGPRINRIEVKLSDSESESDAETVSTDKVKSTSENYYLKELRKPKTPAMVLPLTLSRNIAGFGRGVNLASSKAPPGALSPQPDVSMAAEDSSQFSGVRMALPGRSGRGVTRSASPVRAPPGFGPMMYSEDFPRQGCGSAFSMRPPTQATLAHILSSRRSRGVPPQM